MGGVGVPNQEAGRWDWTIEEHTKGNIKLKPIKDKSTKEEITNVCSGCTVNTRSGQNKPTKTGSFSPEWGKRQRQETQWAQVYFFNNFAASKFLPLLLCQC